MYVGAADRFNVTGSSVVVNEASADVDFRVESNGNTHMLFVDGGTNHVGIGQIPSDAYLHINGNFETDYAIKFNNTQGNGTAEWGFRSHGTNGETLSVYDVTANKQYLTFSNYGTEGVIFNQDSYDQDFRVESNGNTHMLFVDASVDRIGIGTASPDYQLDIENSSHAVARLHAGTNSSASLRLQNDAQDWDVNLQTNDTFAIFNQTNSTQPFSILPSGNVGVGETTPDDTLHVNKSGGTARIRIGSGNDAYYAQKGYLGDTWVFGSGETGDVVTSTISGGNFTSSNDGGAFVWKTDNSGTLSEKMRIKSEGKVGIGLTNPAQNVAIGHTANYDLPGLGNSAAHFAILKRDNSSAGNYGMLTGVSNNGNVWSQVQRTDGTATSYHHYLQPSGGNVAIGLPLKYTHSNNPATALHVAEVRSGTGNVSSYLAKLTIEAIGYAGSNYQLSAIDFRGGDTAGAQNIYGRIGCSTMVGTNNQETGSLEFHVKAPGFGLETEHAMKIHGKADTSSAGGGTTRNAVLFTYQGLAIDRSWANYPCINVMNATPYSSTTSTQAELRIHGNNVSSASYPGVSGSDFGVTVRADGGYATGSDRRRKRNITTIDNALDTVKQLTGKRFQTVNRVEEVQEHVSKNGYKLGFIAQEVEHLIPEAVQYHADEDDGTENWNSSYGMDYGSVVALLVNAIKEQDTTIQDLKSRIETLEG
jgi:hypothetical protein